MTNGDCAGDCAGNGESGKKCRCCWCWCRWGFVAGVVAGVSSCVAADVVVGAGAGVGAGATNVTAAGTDRRSIRAPSDMNDVPPRIQYRIFLSCVRLESCGSICEGAETADADDDEGEGGNTGTGTVIERP